MMTKPAESNVDRVAAESLAASLTAIIESTLDSVNVTDWERRDALLGTLTFLVALRDRGGELPMTLLAAVMLRHNVTLAMAAMIRAGSRS